MGTRHDRELILCQKGMELAKLCHKLGKTESLSENRLPSPRLRGEGLGVRGCRIGTKTFPKEELFALTSQIRRARASIPANIAQGSARTHTKEYLKHLSIARKIAGRSEDIPDSHRRSGATQRQRSGKLPQSPQRDRPNARGTEEVSGTSNLTSSLCPRPSPLTPHASRLTPHHHRSREEPTT
jgi:four helix bundle protein